MLMNVRAGGMDRLLGGIEPVTSWLRSLLEHPDFKAMFEECRSVDESIWPTTYDCNSLYLIREFVEGGCMGIGVGIRVDVWIRVRVGEDVLLRASICEGDVSR